MGYCSIQYTMAAKYNYFWNRKNAISKQLSATDLDNLFWSMILRSCKNVTGGVGVIESKFAKKITWKEKNRPL